MQAKVVLDVSAQIGKTRAPIHWILNLSTYSLFLLFYYYYHYYYYKYPYRIIYSTFVIVINIIIFNGFFLIHKHI